MTIRFVCQILRRHRGHDWVQTRPLLENVLDVCDTPFNVCNFGCKRLHNVTGSRRVLRMDRGTGKKFKMAS